MIASGGMLFHRFALLCALALLPAPAAANSQSPWHGAREGVALKATALQREQVAAFYQARGFAPAAIADYAAACVFSLELHNGGRQPLRLRLADLRAQSPSGTVRFRQPQAWQAEWDRLGVAEPARIAFRWAQFQAGQEFAPGDWIMGMAALERRIDAPFRLVLQFSDRKRSHEIAIDHVRCAPLD